jgi:hypothetical protein
MRGLQTAAALALYVTVSVSTCMCSALRLRYPLCRVSTLCDGVGEHLHVLGSGCATPYRASQVLGADAADLVTSFREVEKVPSRCMHTHSVGGSILHLS